MNTKSIPAEFDTPAMRGLWKAAREAHDTRPDASTCVVPPLDSAGRLTLNTLLTRQQPPRRVRLAALEDALAAYGLGDTLCEQLTQLGFPPSTDKRQRRADQLRRQQAQQRLASATAQWPEPWANAWAADIRASGLLAKLDAKQADDLATKVRKFLDHIPASPHACENRGDIAARLFATAHDLDPDSKLAKAVLRALRHKHGDLADKDLWACAGIRDTQVSNPALVWRLPAVGAGPVDRIAHTATAAGIPIHLSLMALTKHPPLLDGAQPILIVENPRIVEAAAERNYPQCVAATSGWPGRAVNELVTQLNRQGAHISYHGDFDATGIDICRHMIERHGCIPYKMSALDYTSATRAAQRQGIRLAIDDQRCGPTPWDPTLQPAYDKTRHRINEESLMDAILDPQDLFAR